MPSDARVEIKKGDVKSTGTMEGDISIGDAKSSYFRARSLRQQSFSPPSNGHTGGG